MNRRAVSAPYLLINAVAQRFTHFSAVFDDHALGQQVGKRFVVFNKACVTQYLHEETGIQQMQDRMLDTADILIDRSPVINSFFAERGSGVFRVGIPQIIPGRTQEGIHSIGLAAGRLAAFGAGAIDKAVAGCQRRNTSGVKLDVFRQTHRQLCFRYQHFAAVRAVNDRDRRAPVTLTADKPVAQAVRAAVCPRRAGRRCRSCSRSGTARPSSAGARKWRRAGGS